MGDALPKRPKALRVPVLKFLGTVTIYAFMQSVVLVDFTVSDRAALRDALVAELAPRFQGCTIVVNFDTDYTD